MSILITQCKFNHFHERHQIKGFSIICWWELMRSPSVGGFPSYCWKTSDKCAPEKPDLYNPSKLGCRETKYFSSKASFSYIWEIWSERKNLVISEEDRLHVFHQLRPSEGFFLAWSNEIFHNPRNKMCPNSWGWKRSVSEEVWRTAGGPFSHILELPKYPVLLAERESRH